MRIGIVGTGAAGLSVAHRLHRSHDLVLFERNDYIGGHAHTVDVPCSDGEIPVDTGFIVFNEGNYPLFSALVRELSLPFIEAPMSFAVRCDRSGLQYNPHSLQSLFAQPLNALSPAFWRMLWDVGRFRRSFDDLTSSQSEDLTLGAYLAQNGYSRLFTEKLIIPLGAAIWSASTDDVEAFPLKTFVTFFRNHGFLGLRRHHHWRTIKGGSRSYVTALCAPFQENVRLSSPVSSVQRRDDSIIVTTTDGTAESFDHVVLACHSNEALDLLVDPTPEERDVLGALPYSDNETVLHKDASILPTKRSTWGCWNYLIPRQDQERVTISYYMNLLQSLQTSDDLCVSLNLGSTIDESLVIGRYAYSHPRYDHAAIMAQQRWAEISGPRRIHFAGAYWGYGFHEDAVRSGYAVADAIDQTNG